MTASLVQFQEDYRDLGPPDDVSQSICKKIVPPVRSLCKFNTYDLNFLFSETSTTLTPFPRDITRLVIHGPSSMLISIERVWKSALADFSKSFLENEEATLSWFPRIDLVLRAVEVEPGGWAL